MNQKQITVTSPLLPPLDEFLPYLEDIWKRKWLTNNGHYHQMLEDALCEYLGVKYLSLFSNGTLALITALQAMRITGEVITTPYSFVATTHSLWWNGIKPVFVDVEPKYLNIDPQKIEAAITPKTTAIMAVHVYGNPCDVDAIQKIADTYGLKVIYDAAHAFGVRRDNESILNFGDMSILSFHATKVYNTIEGGAIICQDEKMKKRIDYLKNFGFADETTVVAPGINAKMNELQAAFGLLELKYVDAAIAERKAITKEYQEILQNVPGVKLIYEDERVQHAYPYFPILIHEDEYGLSREFVYSALKERNILSRRYFYPLISEFPTYKGLSSSAVDNLPIANIAAKEILCLPIYPGLGLDDVRMIANLIVDKIQ
jgi:dTDP-4-amino-4,6-dideoxygalactose transaminase